LVALIISSSNKSKDKNSLPNVVDNSIKTNRLNTVIQETGVEKRGCIGVVVGVAAAIAIILGIFLMIFIFCSVMAY